MSQQKLCLIFQDNDWQKSFQELLDRISDTDIKNDFKKLFESFIQSVQKILDEQQNLLIETDENRKYHENRCKEIEIQLIQSDKLASVGELAGGVAHEVNNPLAAISGIVQILLASRDKEKLSPSTVERLKKIEKQSDRISKITNDLLRFSRKPSVTFDSLNIHQSLRETLDLVSHQSSLKKIEIKMDFSDNIPLIYGSQNQLEQVFLNLIINSVDAMHGSGGTLTIRTYMENEQCVVIEFIDTGIGISPLNKDRIFDPFFTTKPSGHGVGLGLSVSYSIIKDHGGAIQVDSEEEKGSTFTVKLPLNRAYRITDGTGITPKSVHRRKCDPSGVTHCHLRRRDRNLPNIEREFLTQLLSIWHQSDLEVMASIDERKIEEVGTLTGQRLYKIIPEKPVRWNPKQFAQVLSKYIRLPRGVKLNFTSITDEDITLKFSCCQPEIMHSNPSAACGFTYYFWNSILKSAFPQGEVYVAGTMGYGAPVCELKFLLNPTPDAAKDAKSSLDNIKNNQEYIPFPEKSE